MTTGQLSNPGQHDWIKAQLIAGQAYLITVTGLLSDDSVAIGSASLLDEGVSAFGTFTPGSAAAGGTTTLFFTPDTTGTYYIDVSDPAAAAAEPYTVDLSTVTVDRSDNAQTNGVLTVGAAPVSGTLAYANQHDWLRVTLTAGQAYVFTLDGSTAYDSLEVGTQAQLDEGQKASASGAPEPGENGESVAFFQPTVSGDYYVDVTSPIGDTPYTVSAVAVTTDYAGNASTTGTVAVGGSTKLALTQTGQNDWLAVSLAAGQAYVVTLSGGTFPSIEIGSAADLDGGGTTPLNAASGVAPVGPVVGGPGLTASAFFRPEQAGIYYVDASDEDGTGIETVSVAAVATDVTDNAATTGRLTPGGAVTQGTLGYSGQRDWYAVQLVAGQAYQGVVSGPGDLRIEIGAANDLATSVAISGSDYANTFEYETFYRPGTTGVYYVQVSGEADAAAFSSGSGDYAVSVAPVMTDVAGDASTTGSVAVGGQFQGEITAAGQHDWIAVTLQAGVAYEVTSAARFEAELQIGTAASLDDDTGLTSDLPGDGGTITSAPSVFFRPDTSGVYYVDVASFYGLGSYTVGVQAVTTDTTNNAATTASVTPTPLGDVFAQAVAVLSPTSLEFGATHYGSLKTLAINNAATSPAEGLDATIAADGADFLAYGDTYLLQPGSTGTLDVEVLTDAEGPISGSATVSLSSDGTGTSGRGTTPLPSQTVALSAVNYAYATLSADDDTAFPAARVGDSTPFVNFDLANGAAPDPYRESGVYAIGAVPAPYTLASAATGTVVAGQSAAVSLALSTAAAGTFDDFLPISVTSIGAGTSGLPDTPILAQPVFIYGYVYAPAVASAPFRFDAGNIHQLETGSKTLDISNVATGALTDYLSATVASVGGDFDAYTTSYQAAAGQSDTIAIGSSTADAGPISGDIAVSLVSGDDMLPDLSLPSISIPLSATVYEYATPSFSDAVVDFGVDLGAARVGDAALAGSFSIFNGDAPSAYQESAVYGLGSLDDPYIVGGSADGIIASGGSVSIGLSLPTSEAGEFDSSLEISFTSTGAGTSGLPDTPLDPGSVDLDGSVYAPAVEDIDTSSLDFGIVHVGDEAMLSIPIANYATGALADELVVTTSLPGDSPFDAPTYFYAGSGETDALQVTLETYQAGDYAATLDLDVASHDDQLPDLALPGASIALTGSVYNYADPVLTGTGGDFYPDDEGNAVLNLGTLVEGDDSGLAAITVANAASGPADALSGAFAVVSGGAGFDNTGLNAVDDLVAGQQSIDYVALDTSTPGMFTETLSFTPAGSNPSGYSGALPTQTITIDGVVVSPPPPQTTQPQPLQPAPPTPSAAGPIGIFVQPATIDFGYVKLGSKVSAPLTVTDDEPSTSPAITATLNAANTTGDATGGGVVAGLAPGGANTGAITAGIDTSSVGAKSGTVTVDLRSNGPDPETVQTSTLDFESDGQNIFGPDSGPVTVPLLSASAGAYGTGSVGGYSVSAEGDIDDTLSLTATAFNDGTADVSYPVDAGIELPTAVEAGSDFTVDVTVLGTGRLGLSTTYAADKAGLTLSNTVDGQVSASGTLPIVGDFSESTGPLSETQTLSKDLAVDPIDFNAGAASFHAGLPGTIATTGTAQSSGDILPDLAASGTSSADLLSVSGDILPFLVGPEAEALDVTLKGGIVVDLAGLDAKLALNEAQSFVFHPTGIDVTLTTNADPDDPVVTSLDQPVTLAVPAGWTQPFVVTALYGLDGTLTTKTGLAVTGNATLNIGKLSIPKSLIFPSNKSGETWSVGPVVQQKLPELNSPMLTLATSGPFDLGGFAPVSETYTIPVVPASGAPAPADLGSRTVSVSGVVTRTGSASGDTHIDTFDGLHYDFQGAGEFVFAKTSALEVQVRIEPTGGAQHPLGVVSYINQTAIQSGPDRLTFDFTRAEPFWLNGKAQTLEAGDAVTLGSGTIVRDNGYSSYVVTTAAGDSVTMSGSATQVSLADGGPIGGLLGNGNGDPALDLALPDGTVLTQPLAAGQLYGAFADAWRVTQQDSLFDYGPGETTATYTNTAFPSYPVTLSDLPANLVSIAQQEATAAGIINPVDRDDAALDSLLGAADPAVAADDARASIGDTSTTQLAAASAAPAPALGVSGPGTTVEAGSAATFTVYLTSPASQATTVDWDVLDPNLTGVIGAGDFPSGDLPSGRITIAAGASSTTFSVVTPATLALPDEMLQVGIAPSAQVALLDATGGADVRSSVALRGLDAALALALPAAAGTISESGGVYMVALDPVALSDVAPITIGIDNTADALGDNLEIASGALSPVSGSGFVATVAGAGAIAPGDAAGTITLSPLAVTGDYTETFQIEPIEANDSGFTGALPPVTLIVSDAISEPACFLAGTRIRIGAGEAPVETLRAGDVVETRNGPRRVRWVGSRRIDLRRHPQPQDAWPIRICAGAFAGNVPSRDLLVSPDHCIFIDGKLVPARLLRNGGSILQDRSFSHVHYFHVELDAHAILFAEGLAAESYLDTGNRHTFVGQDALTLHPAFAIWPEHQNWPEHACAPLAVDPETVAPIWRRLRDRSLDLGVTRAAREQVAERWSWRIHEAELPETTADPMLRLKAGKLSLRPAVYSGLRYVFVIPRGVASVRLVSRSSRPCDSQPWLDDRRSIGVNVGRAVFQTEADVKTIDLSALSLSDGWWPSDGAAGASRWTTGDAELTVGPSVDDGLLELTLAGTAVYMKDSSSPSTAVVSALARQARAPEDLRADR